MKRLRLATLIILGACAALAPARSQPAPPLRVQFIGNSLTYVNDLPAMVEAAAGGGRRVDCESIAYPDFGLEEHWRHGFHPSPLGTYLGALMFAEHITGTRPSPPASPMQGASPAQVRSLHTAAAYGLRPRGR